MSKLPIVILLANLSFTTLTFQFFFFSFTITNMVIFLSVQSSQWSFESIKCRIFGKFYVSLKYNVIYFRYYIETFYDIVKVCITFLVCWMMLTFGNHRIKWFIELNLFHVLCSLSIGPNWIPFPTKNENKFNKNNRVHKTT